VVAPLTWVAVGDLLGPPENERDLSA
jgi:hypothetical protein